MGKRKQGGKATSSLTHINSKDARVASCRKKTHIPEWVRRPVLLQQARPLQVLTLKVLQVQLQEEQLLHLLPPPPVPSPQRLVLEILRVLQAQPHSGLVHSQLEPQLEPQLLAPKHNKTLMLGMT